MWAMKKVHWAVASPETAVSLLLTSLFLLFSPTVCRAQCPTAASALLSGSEEQKVYAVSVPCPFAAVAESRRPTTPDRAELTPVGRSLNTMSKTLADPTLEKSQAGTQSVVSVQNLSNILFADQFPNGVPDAVSACPAVGCVIYAVSPNVNPNLGTIDPESKVITMYLGPFTFTVNQITLRSGLKIIGMGAGTTLQSVNGNNPVFVLPQANNSPAANVVLSGFQLLGSLGNTSEDGIFLDTSSTINSGLWYSTIENIFMAGFAGVALHVRGPSNDFASLSEWVQFSNVTAFRTSGGGNALRLEGGVFELRFVNCHFDGPATGDGTNIYIGGLEGGMSGYPTSITFEGLVSQRAGTAVQIDGALNVTFHSSHHEQLFGAYQINNTHNIWTQGVTITESYFAGDVGSNNGSGFLLGLSTTLAQGVSFSHNQIFGTPDSIVKGMNLASVSYQDNMFNGSAPPTSGITSQIVTSNIINIRGTHSVGLNESPIPIATIESSLGPGEMVTFFTIGGPVVFVAGGNINLLGLKALRVNGSITFVRSDLAGLNWIPVSQWNPASLVSPISIRPR
jgi:hypothetical protein